MTRYLMHCSDCQDVQKAKKQTKFFVLNINLLSFFYSSTSLHPLSACFFISFYTFLNAVLASSLIFSTNSVTLFTFPFLLTVISQTLKHVQDMFNFNMTSNPCGYLVLFVSKTPLVVWYFIMDLIPPKVHGYFALFESKSAVIFICIHCLIIFFKLHKFTRNLRGVFPSSNLNSYIVFH